MSFLLKQNRTPTKFSLLSENKDIIQDQSKPLQAVLNIADLREGSNCTELSLRLSEQNILGELKLLKNNRLQ